MLEPGQTIERYTVEAVIGQGGMAVVYRVKHNRLGSLHALKILTVPKPHIRERLLQEGRVQAGIRHPNVVAVTDVLEINGSPALLMEYVDGPTLEQRLEQLKPDLDEAESLFRGICAGVGEAHAHGLVHRDLKPSNVLLSTTRAGTVAKVTDFGIAKLLEVGDERGTRTNVAMGTPHYMAPEQIRDAKSVDQRADIFSLGCILYELVCGVKPFEGSDVLAVLNAVASARYVSPRKYVPRLPERFVYAIEGTLRVDRNLRPQTCAELEAVLSGRQIEPTTWSPPSIPGDLPAEPAALERSRSLTPPVSRTPSVAPATLENARRTAGTAVPASEAAPEPVPDEVSAPDEVHADTEPDMSRVEAAPPDLDDEEPEAPVPADLASRDTEPIPIGFHEPPTVPTQRPSPASWFDEDQPDPGPHADLGEVAAAPVDPNASTVPSAPLRTATRPPSTRASWLLLLVGIILPLVGLVAIGLTWVGQSHEETGSNGSDALVLSVTRDRPVDLPVHEVAPDEIDEGLEDDLTPQTSGGPPSERPPVASQVARSDHEGGFLFGNSPRPVPEVEPEPEPEPRPRWWSGTGVVEVNLPEGTPTALLAGEDRYPPGVVPAGRYELEVAFGGADPQRVLIFEVRQGQTVQVDCQEDRQRCTIAR